MKIETLYRLCGSETIDAWKFAQVLRKALDAVAIACAAHGETFQHRIEKGIVFVDRTPSKAQKRHIIQQTTKRKRLPT
ncbi:hypothetical protein JKG47_15000 [Acidithiobacillus sp. MC6.1]|nr:hypothetical protein [Acidithiobacillus sp. MC6.1]